MGTWGSAKEQEPVVPWGTRRRRREASTSTSRWSRRTATRSTSSANRPLRSRSSCTPSAIGRASPPTLSASCLTATASTRRRHRRSSTWRMVSSSCDASGVLAEPAHPQRVAGECSASAGKVQGKYRESALLTTIHHTGTVRGDGHLNLPPHRRRDRRDGGAARWGGRLLKF